MKGINGSWTFSLNRSQIGEFLNDRRWFDVTLAMVIFVFFFIERRNTHGPKHGLYIFKCLLVWRIEYNIKEYEHISD